MLMLMLMVVLILLLSGDIDGDVGDEVNVEFEIQKKVKTKTNFNSVRWNKIFMPMQQSNIIINNIIIIINDNIIFTHIRVYNTNTYQRQLNGLSTVHRIASKMSRSI